MKRGLLFILAIASVFTSCNVGNRKSENIEQDSVKKFTITEVWRTDTVLLTPESVIYDRKRDILYVTNLNMEPRMKDANGFISKVDRNGNIVQLRWIEGMSSPKGMTIVGDTLYAADVDEIVAMDINKGEIISKYPIDGKKVPKYFS